jgi:hypothetical protein
MAVDEATREADRLGVIYFASRTTSPLFSQYTYASSIAMALA